MKGATRKHQLGHLNRYFISIHAPVKGATTAPFDFQPRFIAISIHAPVKGATFYFAAYFCRLLHYFNPRTREGCDDAGFLVWALFGLNFNPRTREGCDHSRVVIWKDPLVISIHAPVKGATRVRSRG